MGDYHTNRARPMSSDYRDRNQKKLNAWLGRNAAGTYRLRGGKRVYEIPGRRQPFTVVGADGYVIRFSVAVSRGAQGG